MLDVTDTGEVGGTLQGKRGGVQELEVAGGVARSAHRQDSIVAVQGNAPGIVHRTSGVGSPEKAGAAQRGQVHPTHPACVALATAKGGAKTRDHEPTLAGNADSRRGRTHGKCGHTQVAETLRAEGGWIVVNPKTGTAVIAANFGVAGSCMLYQSTNC